MAVGTSPMEDAACGRAGAVLALSSQPSAISHQPNNCHPERSIRVGFANAQSKDLYPHDNLASPMLVLLSEARAPFAPAQSKGPLSPRQPRFPALVILSAARAAFS